MHRCKQIEDGGLVRNFQIHLFEAQNDKIVFKLLKCAGVRNQHKLHVLQEMHLIAAGSAEATGAAHKHEGQSLELNQTFKL